MKTRQTAKWWTTDDEASWKEVREAFRRDWEQTRHDLGGASPSLRQNVLNTIKQAAGKQRIPPRGVPNFEYYEPGFRFGHGAHRHFSEIYPDWNEDLERALLSDWAEYNDGADWMRQREAVRRGYEYHMLETH